MEYVLLTVKLSQKQRAYVLTAAYNKENFIEYYLPSRLFFHKAVLVRGTKSASEDFTGDEMAPLLQCMFRGTYETMYIEE